MQVGTKVKMSPMWKYEEATGKIIKLGREGEVVVRWDGVPGDWHYTAEQTERLEIIEEDEQG